MVHFMELKLNREHIEKISQRKQMPTCVEAPFLPQCELDRTRGEQCQSGSFAITLQNGSLIVGKMWETRSKIQRDMYYREIEINGVNFQLKNKTNNFNEDLFTPLHDGETFDASRIQPNAIGKFSLSKSGAMCRHGATRYIQY